MQRLAIVRSEAYGGPWSGSGDVGCPVMQGEDVGILVWLSSRHSADSAAASAPTRRRCHSRLLSEMRRKYAGWMELLLYRIGQFRTEIPLLSVAFKLIVCSTTF
jgi:hypothetical protein